MSSGSRGLVGEAMSWVIGLAICAVSLLHYDDIKAAALQIAGLPTPAELSARVEAARAHKETPRSGSSTELRMSRDGHFHADAEVNGRAVEVMVDTGASMVALTYEDAQRAGIYVKDADFTQRVSTANGIGRVAPVTIDRISIGDVTVRNVRGAVAEPGRMTKTLLGMTFLGRLSRAEMRSGVMMLEE